MKYQRPMTITSGFKRYKRDLHLRIEKSTPLIETQRTLELAAATQPTKAHLNMFFTKFAYASLALLSVATSSIASPIAAPKNDVITKRADTLVNHLQSFQSTAEPLISSFTGSPADVTALAAVFADITAKVNVDVFVDADVDVVVSLAADVVVKLIAKLSLFLDLNVDLSVQVDVFISAFVTALDNKHPGCGHSIGLLIPIVVDLNVFISLKLLLSAKILGIISLLGL
ncbi:hypothetical protein C8Q75DRAFT_809096 [Abortiporus biennis]|nr:hypothetical protein C8Q75DRAFT_809096 [Abortiporus biennis]